MQTEQYNTPHKASDAFHRQVTFRSSVAGLLACLFSLGCTHSAQTEMKVQITDKEAIEYIQHEAIGITNGRVILAHGFLRTPETMDHLAKALAGQGIETASIKLIRSTLWGGNHEENARDMITLRKALGWEKVTYAGFSAGGLSALLAASEDTACVKLLLLDPVDHGSLGKEAAQKIHVPTLAILGQPGPGNAHRNAAEMIEALQQGKTTEIADATHCDFEAHPSALCYFLTGSKVDPDRTAAVQASIVQHSTAFLKYP